MNKSKAIENTVTIDGQEITTYQINNDINGNPRHVVHFLNLGVKLGDYGKIPGLVKYRAKWFGGGYVFQAYGRTDVENTLVWMKDQVKQYYSRQGE